LGAAACERRRRRKEKGDVQRGICVIFRSKTMPLRARSSMIAGRPLEDIKKRRAKDQRKEAKEQREERQKTEKEERKKVDGGRNEK